MKSLNWIHFDIIPKLPSMNLKRVLIIDMVSKEESLFRLVLVSNVCTFFETIVFS